jgi:suppressor of fused-like protein
MTDPEAPGWDAIDRALLALYADAPQHFGTIHKHAMGGPDPIDGISVYRRDAPGPHFHLVTYGFSELYRKETAAPERSGYGFELTFRVARAPNDEPPFWAISLLQNIARYVFKTGHVFGPGHYMNANGPIASQQKTDLQAVFFALDPELAPIETPHGRVVFLQVIGVTLDELTLARASSSDVVLSALRARNPLLVTDLARRSVAASIDVRTGASSTSALYVSEADWSVEVGYIRLTLGATAIIELQALFEGRLLQGLPLAVESKSKVVAFRPADTVRVHADGPKLDVTLTTVAAAALLSVLQPKRGEYQTAEIPGLVVRVVPSVIVDVASGATTDVVGE